MSPYRIRPGSWQPARLRWIDHAVLMVVLIADREAAWKPC